MTSLDVSVNNAYPTLKIQFARAISKLTPVSVRCKKSRAKYVRLYQWNSKEDAVS